MPTDLISSATYFSRCGHQWLGAAEPSRQSLTEYMYPKLLPPFVDVRLEEMRIQPLNFTNATNISIVGTSTLSACLVGGEGEFSDAVRLRYVRSDDTRRALVKSDIVKEFLGEVYNRALSGRPRHANKLLFSTIDGWLRGGRVEEVNDLLATMDVSRLPPDVVVAPLAITWAAKSTLDPIVRQGYITKARGRLNTTSGVARSTALLARFG